jgi:hypothetical protein
MNNKNKATKLDRVKRILTEYNCISIENLEKIGYKNPYSPIYYLREQGWEIENGFLNSYSLKSKPGKRTHYYYFLRVLLRVIFVLFLGLLFFYFLKNTKT